MSTIKILNDVILRTKAITALIGNYASIAIDIDVDVQIKFALVYI